MPSVIVLIGRGVPNSSCAWMLIELVPSSLKLIRSLSPRSRLMPLYEASSASLFNWSRRSLYCLTRLRRTTLPPMVVVLATPRSPLTTPPAVAPTSVRSPVERFEIRSLPLSFEAVTLSVSKALALMLATISSTVCATTPSLGERAGGVEAGRNRRGGDRTGGDHDVGLCCC